MFGLMCRYGYCSTNSSSSSSKLLLNININARSISYYSLKNNVFGNDSITACYNKSIANKSNGVSNHIRESQIIMQKRFRKGKGKTAKQTFYRNRAVGEMASKGVDLNVINEEERY